MVIMAVAAEHRMALLAVHRAWAMAEEARLLQGLGLVGRYRQRVQGLPEIPEGLDVVVLGEPQVGGRLVVLEVEAADILVEVVVGFGVAAGSIRWVYYGIVPLMAEGVAADRATQVDLRPPFRTPLREPAILTIRIVVSDKAERRVAQAEMVPS